MSGGGGVVAILVATACVLLIVAIAREATGLGVDFVIRHRPGGRTTVRGRVPSGKAGEIVAFFRRDLKAGGSVIVRGNWGAGRTLRLRISGPLNAFQRQRIRNFLMEHLR